MRSPARMWGSLFIAVGVVYGCRHVMFEGDPVDVGEDADTDTTWIR